ncbi:MAG: GNAT family N-acetyltransferase [Oscillospiraceae bacterium]|nr:GNAT family N-acetyltransferase [Oscillospiraceae bacterium]
MYIVSIQNLAETQREQAAQLLHDAFPHAWESIGDAQQEINEIMQPCDDGEPEILVATHGDEVIGWAGVLPTYDGNVWELHPLVVRKDWRGKGVGRALVQTIEQVARTRGGLTLWCGSDDEKNETCLANANLYNNLPQHLQCFNPGRHPTAFYQKLGFAIVGVMPDANGFGKPDIFMAKSLRN